MDCFVFIIIEKLVLFILLTIKIIDYPIVHIQIAQ